jgi:hypothetical protein
VTERQEPEQERAKGEAKTRPPTVDDECASCRERIKVYDRAWEWMTSTPGLLAAGNYCSPACERYAMRYPEDVALELRTRPTWLGIGA